MENKIPHVLNFVRTHLDFYLYLFLPAGFDWDYVTGWGAIRSKSDKFLATQTPAANKPRFTRRFLQERDIREREKHTELGSIVCFISCVWYISMDQQTKKNL